ncbi:hypothetical protein V9T40_000079 [Parthenolecanium corni]|uniref:Uncharacterized protein n=1 Tax=Parthenolecanium corni TaxID=536013 RepID=A0AAN9TDQ0_9HEMI
MVYDENGKLLGQRILPLDGLQAGYRHISLRTEANFPMSLPMLFCNIELIIYVPDGFADFMAALSDPRAFLSAQDKRAQQMKAMGIEETDIKDVPGGGGAAASAGGGEKGGKPKKEEEKKAEEITLEPITLETLRNEKAFKKTGQKQQKDLEALRKKQLKEKLGIQKAQCTTIEKAIKGRSKPELINDASIKKLITEQMMQWSEMIDRHRKSEWELMKNQLEEQRETMNKVIEIVQADQVKQLEAKYERDLKQMNTTQAKISVETMKEVQNDKTLKTKGDKDRRSREKQQNNTKKFMEERKTLQIKHSREKDKLAAKHEKQKQDLVKEINELMEMYKNEVIEYDLTSKTEFFA